MTLVAWLTLFTIAMAYFGPMIEMAMAGAPPEVVAQHLESDESVLFVVLLLLVNAGFTWSTYAVTARRWHDRDKSGWWSLIGFVPLIGPIWIFIECGFLPGTRGPNRYGDAPGRSELNPVEVFE